uniref:Recep_L_domain domain-containing protein n=2 Tax=Caenorhabditis tropicalis TaxID=1561998 RepID=A0A1I7TY82_9PELO
MNFWHFIICSTFFLSFATSDLDEDLKRILDIYNDNPECHFNYTEISSKTVKFFPKCPSVAGIIVINNNTDLSSKQLEKAFSKLSNFSGGILIENSNLTDLSFFPPKVFKFYCDNYGMFIRNNEFLTNADYLIQLSYIPYAGARECPLSIENNPRLDLSEVCNSQSYTVTELTEMTTKGNLVNCGCQGGEEMLSSSLQDFSDCSIMYGGLNLINVTDTESLSALSNLHDIRGSFNIQNSNFQNLSFLSKLENMCFRSESLVFNLQNNLNMTRLELPTLRSIQNPLWLSITIFENLHPDFCLTIDEFKRLTEMWIGFQKLDAKLCEPSADEYRLCRFVSMADLLNNCVTIIGKVVIGEGDDDHATKLMRVKNIFGTLTIQNTQLKNFSFFDQLSMIVHLEDSDPVIKILGNKNLTYPKIGSISAIHTRFNKTAIIQDNHPKIFNWTNGTCELFGNSPYKMDLLVTYRRMLDYVGEDCGARVDLLSSFDPRMMTFISLIALLWFLV